MQLSHNILLKTSFLICVCAGIGACDNGMKTSVPDFSVQCISTDISAGDSVTFCLEGNPDFLAFYSGEIYSDYEFRHSRTIEPGWEYNLSFESTLEKGIDSGNLSLLISTDFNGDYTDPKSAVWTDITSRFTWANSSAATASTSQSLSEFVTDKPAYIAFKYITDGSYNRPPQWIISSLKLDNTLPSGEIVSRYEINNCGFRTIEMSTADDIISKTVISDTRLSIEGPEVAYPSEHWIISRPLELKSAWETGGDKAIAIKGFAETLPSTWKHAYNKAGVYKAVFVASNQTLSSCNELVKSITIVVNE